MKVKILFCLIIGLIAGTAGGQAIHIVNTTDDVDDMVCNAAHCSLREAINASNTNMGPDSIEFNIPGAGPHMIMLNSPLPGILDTTLVIDGTSQPGNMPMAAQIVVDGSALPPGPSHGLVIYRDKVEIYGLQLQNFPGDGIQIFGGFNGGAPFLSNIAIGTPGRGNVIIGNGSYGVEGPVDRNIRIQGNYIGTNLGFAAGLGNDWDGVFLNVLRGTNVRVGGSGPGQLNYLCSNGYSGLRVVIADPAQFLPGFTITGNVIGTDNTGTRNLGNLGMTFGPLLLGGGITLSGDGPITIGGTGPLGNVIAFNYDGIYVADSNRKTILENSIYCNSNKGIHLAATANNDIQPPAIVCLQGNTLVGTADPNQLIYIYRHDTTGCAGVPCQGKEYLDRVTADANGDWTFDISMWPGSRFTSLAEDGIGNSSEFSECILDPNVIAMNSGPFCPEDTVFLTAMLDTAVGNVEFEWFGPDGYFSTEQNPKDATQSGTYTVVAKIMGCGADSATTDVVVYPFASDTITELCLGDSVVVNGVVYDINNPFGEEIIPGGGPFGCDSLVVINLEFKNSVVARIYTTRPQACPGDTIPFWFDLQNVNGPHDVIYTTGDGTQDTFFGIFDGHQSSVVVGTTDVHFNILDVISQATSCPPMFVQSDSILVSDLTISPVVTDYGGFGVSCFGENDGMITLNAMSTSSPVNYQWNLGLLSGDMVSQLTAGSYAVTVTDGVGCRLVFDTLLTQPTRFEAAVFVDPTTCSGVSDGAVIIDGIVGARGDVEYALNGGTFSPVDSLPFEILNLSPGPLILTLQDSALCGQQLNLSIPLGETPSIDLGPDRSIFSGESLLLDFTSTLDPVDISWSPADILSCTSCPTTTAMPLLDSYVYLTLTDDQGCTAFDSVLIHVFVPKQVYIPTAFSPNEDGNNDRFYIQASDFAENIEYLLVADRWGDVVFEMHDFPANDPGFGWDGTLDGKPMFPAVFTYLARIRFTDGEIIPFSGTVTLVR